MSLTRFACDLGFVHRPIFAAALWSLLTWQAQPALSIGIFFELLWLDLFPVGTFIPPQAILSLLATLTLLSCFPDPDLRIVALVLLSTTPLGYLGAWLEQRYRQRQNLSYNALIIWTKNQKNSLYNPQNLTRIAVVEIFLLNLVIFFLLLLPLLWVLNLLIPWIAQGPQPTWPLLWAIACLGALLSLKIRKAYILAGLTLILGLLFII